MASALRRTRARESERGKAPPSTSGKRSRRFNPPLKKNSQPSQDDKTMENMCTSMAKKTKKVATKSFQPPGKRGSKAAVTGEEPASPHNGGGEDDVLSCAIQSDIRTQDFEGGADENGNHPEGCDLGRPTAHTVLSYCDETRWAQTDEASSSIHCSAGFEDDSLSLGNAEGDMNTKEDEDIDVGVELDPYACLVDDEDKHLHHQSALCLEYPNSDSDTKSDEEEHPSSDIPRRQFKVPRSRPTTYNVSALPKQQMKGTYKKPSAKRKRVQLNLVPQQPDNQGELSIFDFQPSQGVSESEKRPPVDKWNESKSKLNVSIMGRTKEEQVAVDMEVLQVIAKTRMEIKAIRVKYATIKAGRTPADGKPLVSSMKHHIQRIPIKVNFTAASGDRTQRYKIDGGIQSGHRSLRGPAKLQFATTDTIIMDHMMHQKEE